LLVRLFSALIPITGENTTTNAAAGEEPIAGVTDDRDTL